MHAMKLSSIALVLGCLTSISLAAEPYTGIGDFALHYHLMHPGDESWPQDHRIAFTGDPNAAYHLDGTYHLHYIFKAEWKGELSFAYAHVTSSDLLNWSWQPTKLTPSFAGHGMFSGTGFLTADGLPALIYHGQASNRNWITVAKDRQLRAWTKPVSIEPVHADGSRFESRSYWDPDLFVIGDTYYSISGGAETPLFKSRDLKTWTYVGPFLSHEPDDVAHGEDVSCANFFPIGNSGKWMLLCISHSHGCRYYLGEWDAAREQFVPESHHRMNWRPAGVPPHRGKPPQFALQHTDFFAPESLLTEDGRRVMWAWLPTLDVGLQGKTILSLPRALSLGVDGTLRMAPIRELETLRSKPEVLQQVTLDKIPDRGFGHHEQRIVAQLSGESHEIRVTVAREEANRSRLGLRVFAHESDPELGVPIIVDPSTRTLRVGDVSAPFAVAELPEGEDLELRVFVDKYLVEVFANDRQAVVVADLEGWRRKQRGVALYAYGRPRAFEKIEIWSLSPTTAGFHEAARSRIWQVETAR